MKSSKFAFVVAACVFGVACFLVVAKPQAQDASNGWHLVPIPDSWKRQLGGALATKDGYAWYRCFIKVPADWKGKKIELNVEPIDDARQNFVNGVQVGATGSFPPQFRSGLGEKSRFVVPAEALKFGEINVFSVRTYMKDARSNFLVAPPILITGKRAIRTEGQWQYRPGDNKDWATSDVPKSIKDDAPAYFFKVDEVDDLQLYLRRRKGDTDPLPPAEAIKSFTVADDLRLDQVLSEPHIGQPLFINWDERGRLWVLNYKQYPNPAGLKMISRDKFLRAVYDRVPLPPPHGVRGADEITIHEDTDGDGKFDTHKTFVDGLNITSSFERGRGGVFVLSPPYLLFYPDANNDDVPDSDPQVLLKGFGIEDSHSIANSLRWGPDGWLYACQGSTVTGRIIRPGIDTVPIHSMGQLIWRYHPVTRRYEVFAEGGGNTFGCEIDDKGRIFSGTNGGNARGFHYVQGAYERKGFSKHGALSNPYAFGYFPTMKHHSVPRFTHNFIIYSGGALPEKYNGRLFGIEPLQGQIVQSTITPNTTTFETKDIDRPVLCSDQWFRPVDIKVGPDGAIYFGDLYEQRIDHASHYAGRVTPETGRVYRIRALHPKRTNKFNYGTMATSELVKRMSHPNKWHRQTILRVLADRRDRSAIPYLRARILESAGQTALESCWALNLCGGLTDEIADELLAHEDQYVRLWAVRLLADARRVSPKVGSRLVEMSATESYAEVRSQLACSAKRLPAKIAAPMIGNLLTHSEDMNDLHIPLLLWWAMESKAADGREEVAKLFADKKFWNLPLVQEHILDRIIRRYALSGSRQDLLACATLLELAPEKKHQDILMKGFEAAYAGRSLANLPDELISAISSVGGGSLVLQVRQGIPEATQNALKTVASSKDDKQRMTLIRIFGEVTNKDAVPVLLDVVTKANSDALKSSALLSLEAYSDSDIADIVVGNYAKFSEPVRESAQTLLSSRRAWATKLVNAVGSGAIDKKTIPIETRRRLLLHNDEKLRTLVEEQFGRVAGATSAQMQQRIEELNAMLQDAKGSGNPYTGKVLYKKTCGKCHVLFTQGGSIGPDLTSFKRDDIQGILLNVVNPSAEIRKGFENYTVRTLEGRIVTGFLIDQDTQVVVLRGADGQNVVIPRDDIDDMAANTKSLMPEGLLDKLSDAEIKHLFAYLRSTQPLAN
ncbi:MAG: dehydrogenase [Planctomycetaceae bacterium]|nr:dehydrogenase [Planctomycetaceae bacterium]